MDLLIGFTTSNHADCIGEATAQVALGCRRFFPGVTAHIVCADTNSIDATRSAFLEARTGPVEKTYVSTFPGLAGRGLAMREILQIARERDPIALVVIDPRQPGIAPEWVRNLAKPIERGYDLAIGHFTRHAYDRPLTNHLVYPLAQAALGVDHREPATFAFGCKPSLAAHWLIDEWPRGANGLGAGIYQTLSAVLDGFGVCDVGLGPQALPPRIAADETEFVETVEALFETLRLRREEWEWRDRFTSAPCFGSLEAGEPPAPSADYGALRAFVETRLKEHRSTIKSVLCGGSSIEIEKILKGSATLLGLDEWRRVCFEFLAYYCAEPSPAVVQALFPLFGLRALSFVSLTGELDAAAAERSIRAQAQRMFETRGTLLDRLTAEESQRTAWTMGDARLAESVTDEPLVLDE